MAYIISVNAAILTDSGATCVCPHNADDPTCQNSSEYSNCLIGMKYHLSLDLGLLIFSISDVQRDLITATAAISGFASCLFGLTTNLPVALAPGMGLNAYFAYQVVGYHGTGNISYQLALAAIFTEGWIFILLSLLGMRQWLVKTIPTSIKIASACGIGLFLALIGLSSSAGIGAITGSYPAPLDLGGCPPQYLDDVGHCASHKMQNPAVSHCILIDGPALLTAEIAVDWSILWWHAYHNSNGLQGEERYDYWDYPGVHNILAVNMNPNTRGPKGRTANTY